MSNSLVTLQIKSSNGPQTTVYSDSAEYTQVYDLNLTKGNTRKSEKNLLINYKNTALSKGAFSFIQFLDISQNLKNSL